MRKCFQIMKWAVIFFFVSTVLLVLAFRWLPVPFTPLMVIRAGQAFVDHRPVNIHHEWISLKEMPPAMPQAVIASEDQNFMRHHGFDFGAIRQAVQEKKERNRVRGASTITQQTAKNVFLWPSSTWVRKGFEAYFTVLIELLWSKERIMEVYLNSIEMGPQTFGVQAVAQRHFGCNASQLRRKDCALIAATLPNPLRYSSLRPSRYMQKRTRQIEHQMKFISPITWQ